MPLPAILVPRFHLLPNDSEKTTTKKQPPPPVSSISAGFGSLDTKNNTTSPIYLTRCPPHPNNVAMVPAPWCSVPDLSEKSVTPSVDALVPDTVNTDAEIDKVPTSLRPVPPPPSQPVPMVPPSWPCLLCPHEKLTVQAIRATSKRQFA